MCRFLGIKADRVILALISILNAEQLYLHVLTLVMDHLPLTSHMNCVCVGGGGGGAGAGTTF